MKKVLKNNKKSLKLTTLGFTLIELLAVIIILAIVALISTPIIMDVIEDARESSLERTYESIERAAQLYLYDEYDGYVGETGSMTIPMSELKSMINNYSSEMDNESVVVRKESNGISYYYTGRDKNPYETIGSLKEKIEEDTAHIKMNVVVNGKTVNKVYGLKSEKDSVMKNYVWYSGNLWQVLETSDNYIKMVLAHSITSIAYGATSDWETSWVRKWLNDIDEEYSGVFYNGLERTDIILDGNFCLDEVDVTTSLKVNDGSSYVVTVPTSSTKISSCQNISTDKVGLLTFEDYVYANTGNSATYTGGSFLDEDELMWTMTPYTKATSNNTKYVWTQWYNNIDGKSGTLAIDTGGTVDSVTKGSTFRTDTYGLGVRPVIYIKSDAEVKEGTGSKKDPFIISANNEYEEGSKLSDVTIGEYIYLDEGNAPSGNHSSVIVNGYSITYDKNKVAYRVIDILEDGSIKVERADVLRGLDSTISIRSNLYIPYYYKWDSNSTSNTCGCENGTGSACYWNCSGKNYYQPTLGSGEYNWQESENIGYYLNNASNSYYNWFTDEIKNYISESEWNLAVTPHGKDYSEIKSYTTEGSYPNRKSDGVITAKVGLPTYGERYSGNDLNITYWYINRMNGSSSSVGVVHNIGRAPADSAGYYWHAARPVIILKSNIVIESGNGTMASPYTIKG